MIRFVDRKGTNSYKWDMKVEGAPDDVIPMWVADMDFAVPDEILKAMRKRLEHGVFGYTFAPDEYFQSISEWWKERHGIDIKKDWIVHVPGVVAGIATALLSFTREGDGVIVQPPVYWPFFSTIEKNDRRVIENPLLEENGYYTVDLDDLRSKLERSKAFLLCSPHNPVGRVWKEEELSELVEVLKSFDGVVISDEIHMDFVFSGKFKSLVEFEKIHEKLIVLSAPNKTFNVPGLKGGYAIIPSSDLRKRFEDKLKALHISSPNPFIIEATISAYRYGKPWLDELLKYIRSNFEMVKEKLESTGKVNVKIPEGTYLMWLDFRKSGLKDPFRDVLKAGVWLQDGRIFRKGEGFLRMNVATSKEILQRALDRIVKVLG